MKILVTGSRNWPWDQRLKVFSYLNRAALNAKEVILLHGACPYGTAIPNSPYKGADGLSDRHGRLLGWDVRPFPPEPSEGPSRFAVRNAVMVAERPDKVLAFYLRGAENKGSRMTANMAKRKGLWVLEIWSD